MGIALLAAIMGLGSLVLHGLNHPDANVFAVGTIIILAMMEKRK